MNARYGTQLTVDGRYGPATKKALIIGLQTELNQQYQRGLAVDGSLSPATKAAIVYTKRAQGKYHSGWCRPHSIVKGMIRRD
ncbi:MAG: peptidoglycan-binding domain-containing protein [Clostridia bacterium]